MENKINLGLVIFKEDSIMINNRILGLLLIIVSLFHGIMNLTEGSDILVHLLLIIFGLGKMFISKKFSKI